MNPRTTVHLFRWHIPQKQKRRQGIMSVEKKRRQSQEVPGWPQSFFFWGGGALALREDLADRRNSHTMGLGREIPGQIPRAGDAGTGSIHSGRASALHNRRLLSHRTSLWLSPCNRTEILTNTIQPWHAACHVRCGMVIYAYRKDMP